MSGCRVVMSVTKTCQSCGAAFACGLCCCWCDGVPLSAEAAAQLRGQFSDCLCRPCLEAAAARARDGEPAPAGGHV